MRRRRDERGAVLVELAMCVPLLIILSLGIIDYGHAFTDKITLKGGVREAVWNGSRQVWGSAVDCGLVGVTGSGDAAADANTKRIMCMAKTRTQLPASEIRSKVIFYDIGNPAASVPYGPGAGIMVCTMRMGRSVTGFFSFTIDNTVQRAKLGTVIIKADAPGMSALQESPLPGQSWSFCDASAAAST
jgi:hypothetical protein